MVPPWYHRPTGLPTGSISSAPHSALGCALADTGGGGCGLADTGGGPHQRGKRGKLIHARNRNEDVVAFYHHYQLHNGVIGNVFGDIQGVVHLREGR